MPWSNSGSECPILKNTNLEGIFVQKQRYIRWLSYQTYPESIHKTHQNWYISASQSLSLCWGILLRGVCVCVHTYLCHSVKITK